VSISNDVVTVSNADSAIIAISAETDYWNTGYTASELQQLVQSRISSAISTGFSTVYSEHTTDFRQFFDRTILNLDSPTTNSSLDIPARYDAYKAGAVDQALEALLFSFGRYLMISSSRAGSLPPNLLGIWNPQNDPSWGGKFTTDLNVEMNHWLTETTGLSEMSLQLFNFTQSRVMPNGAITAKTLYNASGWCSHHNNDLWGDTAPHDK
jgi:alpha-L-fucosidase 2